MCLPTRSLLVDFRVNFTDSPDGFNPLTSPLLDDRGDLYGATHGGGRHRESGMVFKITP
jgi:hypothetical protein